MDGVPLERKHGVQVALDLSSVAGFIIRLKSNPDSTEAYFSVEDFPLKFSPAEEACKIREAIRKKIKIGLDERFLEHDLERLLSSRTPIIDKVIAQGTPAVQGRDAVIEYHVPRPTQEFLMRADGTCDYKNRDLFGSCSEGQIILVKQAPQAGRFGINIFGAPIPPAREKDLLLNPGKNVTLTYQDDTQIVKATADGQVIYDVGSSFIGIQVLPVLTIRGDVDYSTGNINFKGSVEVRGSILTGFSVVATGNVSIFGVVESGAKVTAGGDITIRKGIIGSIADKDPGEVKAFGNLQAAYGENAIITAQGDIFLNSAMNCQISTNNCLFVAKNILGGEIVAFKSIEASEIGSPVGLKTMIRSGVSHTTFNRLNLMIKILEDIKQQFAKAEQNLQFVTEKGASLPADKRRLLTSSLTLKVGSLREQIMKLEMKKADLAMELLEQNRATVSAKLFHPGVVIFIRSSQFDVVTEHQSVTFFQRFPEETIDVRPFHSPKSSKARSVGKSGSRR